MLIQGTKKILDQLNIKPAGLTAPQEELFSWHANLVTMKRRKTVLLMNDATRYIVVLWGMKQNEFQNIDYWLTEGLRQTMLAEQIKPELVERYLNEAGAIKFEKTKNRSQTAKLNQVKETLFYFEDELSTNSVIQTGIAIKSSKRPVGSGPGNYISPNEWFYTELRKRYGQELFKCPMVELEIRLQLEGEPVVRQITVPLSRTFQELHKILQVSFEWSDSHLHEFRFAAQAESPEVRLVMDEEAFEYSYGEEKLILEHEVRLVDYLTENLSFQYVYDFGDDWEHVILVKRIWDEKDFNHAVCTRVKGTTPPEDVGGKYGYEDFLKIIGDSKNQEYEEMMEWAKMQRYEEPNSRWINYRLKSL